MRERYRFNSVAVLVSRRGQIVVISRQPSRCYVTYRARRLTPIVRSVISRCERFIIALFRIFFDFKLHHFTPVIDRLKRGNVRARILSLLLAFACVENRRCRTLIFRCHRPPHKRCLPWYERLDNFTLTEKKIVVLVAAVEG